MPTAQVNLFTVLAKLVPFGSSVSSAKSVQANGLIDALGAERVYIGEAAGNITGMVREGADLLLYGPEGELLTIQNFYSGIDPKQLLLLDGDGGLVAMEVAGVTDGPLALYSTPVAEPVPFESLTGQNPNGSEGANSAAAFGAVMAAGLAAGVQDDGGDIVLPDIPLDDMTPPAAPTALAFGANGASLSGKAEPGANISVRDATGKVIGTGRVEADGTFSVALDTPQINSERISVTATDAANNVSDPAHVLAPDLTPPAPATELAVNETGTVITGKGEVGASVEVQNPDGTPIGTGAVSADGTFSITLAPPQTGGGLISVVLTDAVGNESGPATVLAPVIVDEPNGPPGQPVLDIPEAVDGITAAELADGLEAVVTLPQGAQAGQTVTIALNVAGSTYMVTYVIDADDVAAGSAIINLGNTYPDGQYSVVATLSDPDGTSGPPSAPVTFEIDAVSIEVGTNQAALSEATPELNASGQIAFANSPDGQVAVGIPSDQNLTSHGKPIEWHIDADGILRGVADGRLVLSVQVNNDGSYTATLHSGIDHLNGDLQVINIPVIVTDATGSASGILELNVTDGAPVNNGPMTLEPLGPSTLSGTLLVDVGLDGGTLSNVTVDGMTFSLDANGALVASGSSSTILSYTLDHDSLLLTTLRGETVSVNLTTGAYEVLVTGQDALPAAGSAPKVYAGGSVGLGNILQLDALGIVTLAKDQAITVSDTENDITRLEIDFKATISTPGNPFKYDAALAAEFGLRIVVSTPVPDGLQWKRTLTIESTTDGATIDSFKLNEFLASLAINTSLLGILDANLFQSVVVRAYDSEGHTHQATDFTTIDIGVANNFGKGLITPEIIQGSSAADNLTALDPLTSDGFDSRLYGYAGNDRLTGRGGNDLLRGGSGNDTLIGNGGNDILVGGSGNDTLTGGSGIDVFRFERGDIGTAGVETDTITDFDIAPIGAGGDILDLSDMLVGEGRIGNSAGNLANFLHFVQTQAGTEIHISYRGAFTGGYNPVLVDHKILLQGTDLVGSSGSDLAIIGKLLADGKLLVDSLRADTSSAGHLTIGGEFVDGDGDGGQSTVIVDDSRIGDPANNGKPGVGAEAFAIQSLLSGSFGSYDLTQQDLQVADPDNNLAKVSLEFRSFASVGLAQVGFGWDANLAHAFGYTVKTVYDQGVSGILFPSVRLEVTASNGMTLDNEQINAFLKSVHLTNGDGGLFDDVLLDASLLNAMTLTATDVWGESDSDTLGSFVNLNILNSLLGHVGASQARMMVWDDEGGIDADAFELFSGPDDGDDLLDGMALEDFARDVIDDDGPGGESTDALAPQGTAFDPHAVQSHAPIEAFSLHHQPDPFDTLNP